MPNLLKNVQSSFKETFNDKLAIAFMALILVVAINHIVFSYLLFDREKAGASFSSTSVIANNFTVFGDQSVYAGTNDIVLAEFYIPDAWGNDNVVCNYSLSNPCITFVDGDGTVTTGSGSADDGAINLFDTEPNGVFDNLAFQASDGICTDSLTTPTCVYQDSGGDCDVTDGDSHSYLLDSSGLGCGTAADVLVTTSTISPTTPSWVHTELINNNGAYDDGEDIYISTAFEDLVLAQGNYWGQAYTGQWQGDVASTNWVGLGSPGGEGFIDLEPSYGAGDGIFQGSQATTNNEPAIIDLDGDSLYTDGPDQLIEADGSASDGIGTDDDNLADGASLTPLLTSDNVCMNSLWVGVSSNMMIYVDGDGDCMPGSGGTDVLLRDDSGNGLSNIIANFGSWPYLFFNAGGLLLYVDDPALPNTGAYTYGSGAVATESLWLEVQGENIWHPNVEGLPGRLLEADGTASTGVGANDDAVARNVSLNVLSPSDDVCGGTLTTLGGGIEDIYVDGNGDCTPGNGGSDVILLDQTGDGLTSATVYGGTWASLAYSVFYFNNIGGPGYDYGAGAAATESLWLPIWGSQTYSSSADVEIQSQSGKVPGDTLTDLSTASGPNGQPLIYADADGSGTLTANDTVLEDFGNAQYGPNGPSCTSPSPHTGTCVPNGVIDQRQDMFNQAVFGNAGTADSNAGDLTNLRFYADPWFFGGDGKCAGDANDTLIGTFTTDAFGNSLANFSNIQYPVFYRGCIVADIPQTARGRTIRFKIPQLVDNNSNGLYDTGDKGYFSFSDLDGPTDGDILAPDTFTINPIYKRGKKEIGPIVPKEEPAEAPKPSPIIDLPEGVAVGDLIRSQTEQAVYLVTAEGKLRVFPNEIVYYSYYTDFSKVKYVNQEIINQITLGDNVTLRAGTYLMTTPSSEKVYAVEPSGVARWIKTAEIVQGLYGADWQARVVDIPDILLEDYFMGDSIDSLKHPTATLLQYAGSSEIYYIEKGNARLVSQEVFAANNFREEFIVKDVDGAEFDYQIVSPLGEFVDFFMAIERENYKPFLDL
ncbi:MAG: hypothetical protein GF365_04780 [Candidatus Buchananbacteria bacterium]|nr:hypothetical protein [Candidatus Buchananbacteria bacterium]